LSGIAFEFGHDKLTLT